MAASAPSVELDRPRRPEPRTGSGGGGFRPRPPLGYGGGDDGGADGDGFRSGSRLKLGVWIGIAGIVMFFAAISSAMVVRRVGDDWRVLEAPDALWVSTTLLVLSSLAFEAARRQLKRGTLSGFRAAMAATVLLGIGFLAGQLVGWSQLAERGIFLATNPSSSFFYLLTAAHGAHVLGGLGALGFVAAKTLTEEPARDRLPLVEAAALYWHFMDVLWLYLLFLLVYWG